MFQTKVIGYKKIYLLIIISMTLGAKVRTRSPWIF